MIFSTDFQNGLDGYKKGYLYFSDSRNNELLITNEDLDTIVHLAIESEEFDFSGFEVDNEKNIYVLLEDDKYPYLDHKIVKFDSTGIQQTTFEFNPGGNRIRSSLNENIIGLHDYQYVYCINKSLNENINELDFFDLPDDEYITSQLTPNNVGGFTFAVSKSIQQNPWINIPIIYSLDSLCNLSPKDSISGRVYYDKINNGNFDEDDLPYKNKFVMNMIDSSFSITDKHGYFTIPYEEGLNELRLYNFSNKCEYDDYAINFNSDTLNDKNNFNFPIHLTGEEKGVKIDISGFRARCGFPLDYKLNIENIGCNSLNGDVHVYTNDLLEYTGSQNDLSFEVLNLYPDFKDEHVFNFKVANEEFEGDTVKIFVHFTSDEIDTIFTYSSVITCAIDPNEKQIEPVIYDNEGNIYLDKEEEIVYTIRFQNLGSDTAFNIIIEDTLSNYLDVETLRIIASSHEFNGDYKNRLLTFSFNDILLPPKVTNELESQGFISFGIFPKIGIPDFTPIENKALIYFDYNAPIITNNTYSLAVSEFDADSDGYYFWDDCNDNDRTINPGVSETPNNDIDENCDGSLEIVDNDQDGFSSDVDCDDNNAAINPSAEEVPNNDIDENCDGETVIIDNDMDGYNSDEDCDDNNPNINPGAEEIPNNDVDENCNGVIVIIDNDQDGFNSDEDCDDNNPDINPEAEEIPNNGVDENCDGEDLMSGTEDLEVFEVNIYPNPVKDQLIIESSKLLKNIKIFNLQGQLVFSEKTSQNLITLELKMLTSGMYYIQLSVHDSKIQYMRKLVKI